MIKFVSLRKVLIHYLRDIITEIKQIHVFRKMYLMEKSHLCYITQIVIFNIKLLAVSNQQHIFVLNKQKLDGRLTNKAISSNDIINRFVVYQNLNGSDIIKYRRI